MPQVASLREGEDSLVQKLHESAEFNALFPTMRYLKGGVDSGFNHVQPGAYVPKLLQPPLEGGKDFPNFVCNPSSGTLAPLAKHARSAQRRTLRVKAPLRAHGTILRFAQHLKTDSQNR